MRHSFFYDGVLDSLVRLFRPRAPDLADLPDTAEATFSRLCVDYKNEAKFPSRRRRLRAEARDAAGYEWERGRGWIKKKRVEVEDEQDAD